MTVSVQTALNGAIQGRMEPAAQRAALGDLLNELIKGLGNRAERVGPFRQDNAAAAQTNVDITLAAVDAAAPTSIVAPRSGRIIGITARANAAVTVDSATLNPTVNGVEVGSGAVLTTTAQQRVVRLNTPVAFAEGDLLGVSITTTAGFLPITLEIYADLIIDWGSDAIVVQDGLVPASNAVTLATRPDAVLDVFSNAGTSAGHKKLVKGPLTGPQALTPAAGEAVWDGNVTIKFAAADAVTSVRVVAVRSTDAVASVMQADVDQP